MNPVSNTFATPEPASRTGAWLVGAVIALSISGYPLAGLLGIVLDADSTVTSIVFRALVVLISGLSLLHFMGGERRFRFDVAVLLFWWLYLFRLIVDLGTGRFDQVDEALLFFLATVVIPGLAAMISAEGYDERLTARMLFVLGAAVSAGSVLLNAFGSGEAALTEVTGRLSFNVLNPITLGHVAVTTMVAALALWKAPGLPGGRIALAAGVAVAGVCLVLAASRGPVLALMVVLISYSVLRGRWGRIFAGVLAVFLVAPMILATQGVEIVERFTNIASDLSARERLIIQGNALDQGLASPVWGSAYTELMSGQYPHNLIIESFMAMGAVGLVLFLLISAKAGLQAALRLRAGELLLPLLLVQYFIAAMFSGSIWGSAGLWLVATLLATTVRWMPERAQP